MPVSKSSAFIGFIFFLFFTGFSKIYADRFGRVISFGDSLSDSGNYAEIYKVSTGTKLYTGSTKSLEGRASNGLLWCEQLYNKQVKTDNFAYISAQSGRSLDRAHEKLMNCDVPSLDYQIDMALFGVVNPLNPLENLKEKVPQTYSGFMADFNREYEADMNAGVVHSEGYIIDKINTIVKKSFEDVKKKGTYRKLDPKALYTIWVGMNDLRDMKLYKKTNTLTPDELKNVTSKNLEIAETCIHNAMSNIHHGVKRLYNAGARNFVILGLPTIFQKTDDPDAELAGVKLFNLKLWQKLQTISKEHSDINIIPVDIEALGELVVSGKYDFGMTNVDQNRPFRTSDSDVDNKVKDILNKTLFWDHYGHLTAIGNKILADYIRMVIAAPYDIIPQLRAIEKGASQAGRNVSNRLFHLRGGLDVHSPSASSLMSHAFTSSNDNAPAFNVPQEGEPTHLRAFKAKRFAANSNPHPMMDEDKKNAIPAVNFGGESAGKLGVFISGDYYYGRHKDTDAIEGYRHCSTTLTIGGDYRFSDWFLGGVAMSYTKGKTKINAGRGQTKLDGYSVTLYDSLKFGGFYLDSAASYGWNQIDVERNIKPFKATAKAQPIGTNWGVNGLIGYDFNCGPLRFGPTANLNYGQTKITSYREDHGEIFNQIVHAQNTTTFVGALGGHVSYDFKVGEGVFTPTLHGSYDHEFKNRDRELVTELASMRGIPQHLPVPSNDNDYFRIGGGFNWKFRDNSAFSFDYETIVAKKHSRDHFFFVKYRHLF